MRGPPIKGLSGIHGICELVSGTYFTSELPSLAGSCQKGCGLWDADD